MVSGLNRTIPNGTVAPGKFIPHTQAGNPPVPIKLLTSLPYWAGSKNLFLLFGTGFTILVYFNQKPSRIRREILIPPPRI